MSGVVIVGHGPNEVDNSLWLRMLERRPDALLVVPGCSTVDWDLPASVRERVVPLRTYRLGSDTAAWHRGLLGLVDRSRPDVIHIDSEPWSLTAQAMVQRGYRTVVHCAENLIADAPLPYRVRRMGMQRTLLGLAGVATWGWTTMRALEASGLPPTTPTAVLPARPPSPVTFTPRSLRPFADPLRVGYVGRLVRGKGVDVAIRAAKEVMLPVTIHIMGAGPERESLQSLARECGITVEFHAASEPTEVADFLSRMDVVVAPSRRSRMWTEQWCRVAVEAMAVGRPVLATDSGELRGTIGVPEWIFPEDDHRALASILDGMHSQEVLERASRRARESAARFRPDLLVEQLDGLWERALARQLP